MREYYNDNGVVVYQGDCLEVLKGMDSESVDMCITSPPYWGLRDYQSEPHIWDGIEGCEHEWGADLFERKRGNASGPTAQVGNTKKEICGIGIGQGNFCVKCNAWKGNLGLEPTYQLFIIHLIQIFDEVKRVLKDSGTCWVNLGDSYGGSWGNYGAREGNQREQNIERFERPGALPENHKPATANMLPKSLIGIPERFCIAMTDAGWIRRNTIIWYKPNCMPSSANDRFTVDFEYLYFFTKNTRYWFEQQFDETKEYKVKTPSSWDTEPGPHNTIHRQGRGKSIDTGETRNGRNKRCVWKIPTQSYSDAHFATYPEELVYTPIKAGCPKGGTVCDPFMGSGTTLKVAKQLGRKGIGIELNPEYIDMALKRINVKQGVFSL